MEINTANASASGVNGELDGYLGSFQAEKTNIAAVSTSSQMDIRLVTQEGDRVTISLDAKAAALYGTYQRTGVSGNNLSYQQSEVTAALYEREMTFTVEGDLNQDERRDIFKALKTLDRMMHRFNEGQLKPALAGANKLQRLETIAGLDASMSYEKQVLVTEQTRFAAAYSAPTIGAVPSHASIQDAAMATQTAVPQLFEAADTLADEMTQTIAEISTPWDRMKSFADQLLDDYREQMAQIDRLGVDIIDRIVGRLQEALAKFNDAVTQNAPAVEQ